MASPLSPFPPSSQADEAWFLETAAKQIRAEELRRAERLNGRVAMLGFVFGLALEAISGDGILRQLVDVALLFQR
jgi:hypothetical protein